LGNGNADGWSRSDQEGRRVLDASVTFDIQMVQGFSNVLFGGEGLFLATLTGPGHIALQSMPIMNLAEEIAKHLPSPQAQASAVSGPGSVNVNVGGLLGGLFGNNR
jgi:hypothetical protein